MAKNRLSVTTSRAVRSATNPSSVEGRTSRMRWTASRIAAILPESTIRSTTGGSRQDATRGELLEGAEVQVVEDRARLPFRHQFRLAHEQRDSVAKDPIGHGRRGVVQDHQIHGPPGGPFEVGDE